MTMAWAMDGAWTTGQTVRGPKSQYLIKLQLKFQFSADHILFTVLLGVKCPIPGIVVNGRVTPSLTEYFYRDHIYVRCDQGYKLMVVSLNPFFVCYFKES